MRRILIMILMCASARASALDADKETLAEYAASPPAVRSKFAFDMADTLRPNHPKLTAEFLSGCLDVAAAPKERQAMNLRATVIICAMAGDAGVAEGKEKSDVALGEIVAKIKKATLDRVKVLEPVDLAVQTHKWDGKIIQTTANCFYADAREYRCIPASGSRIDFSFVGPQPARDYVEKNCDTLQGSLSRRCRFLIRFTYEGYSQMEVGGLLGHQTTISAEDGIGVLQPPK